MWQLLPFGSRKPPALPEGFRKLLYFDPPAEPGAFFRAGFDSRTSSIRSVVPTHFAAAFSFAAPRGMPKSPRMSRHTL